MVIQGIVFIWVAQAEQDPVSATSLVPVGKWGAERGAGQLRRDPSALPGGRALEYRHRPPAGAGREVVTEVVITDGDVKARAIAPLPSTWCVAIPFAIRLNFGPIDTLCRDWAIAIPRELQPA